MSQTLHIELADEVMLSLHKQPADLAADMRLAAAAKWYELGMVSQSQAADIAGLSRAEFIAALARFSVSPFQETGAEIIQSLGA